MPKYQLITREEFFLTVWPSKLLRGETLELRVLRREPLRVSHRSFHTKLDSFLSEIDLRSGRTSKAEFYFGVATRRGEGATKELCFRTQVVWVDVDGTKNLQERLSGLTNLEPDIIVDSGGGLHLYWVLYSPIILQDQKWLDIEAINRALCRKMLGDSASVDITRILRVPGSNNNKYDPPKPVRAYKRVSN
jgi:hypothetical protein